MRRHWLPFCGRGASLSRSLYKAQLVVCAHSIATSPRAESSGSDYAAAAYGPLGAEMPPTVQNPYDRPESGQANQVIPRKVQPGAHVRLANHPPAR